jgi:hypothetical protein
MGEKFAVNPVNGTGSREYEPGSGMLGGAHVGIRTRDLFLTKEVLCRLSYVGQFASTRRGAQEVRFRPLATGYPNGTAVPTCLLLERNQAPDRVSSGPRR